MKPFLKISVSFDCTAQFHKINSQWPNTYLKTEVKRSFSCGPEVCFSFTAWPFQIMLLQSC